ncbi:hypothetical protein R3X27_10810 [Tropicimonas sp. TH_r6]|uniref:leucine-rich repeat domain-containing protein n=1 Tax=Tropicimonas sp. TH_r6 TaxID=3082085 RepID=UPI002954BAB6|nr:hypothetical protein [Tropicimonas sp. TH_r6]MDV7143173.1 hypothetical protein [Tropicimonas sp. TH_r6]
MPPRWKRSNARAEGKTEISFDGPAFRALERFPPELARLEGLRYASLSQNSVSDLSALSGHTGLQILWFFSSAVSNLNALSDPTGLRFLYLSQSSVSELPVMAGLEELEALMLDGTNVLDLRPLRWLPKLGTDEFQRLTFHDTPATAADTELARLSEIKGEKERARETLAYLNSLPPWPAPLHPRRPPRWHTAPAHRRGAQAA